MTNLPKELSGTISNLRKRHNSIRKYQKIVLSSSEDDERVRPSTRGDDDFGESSEESETTFKTPKKRMSKPVRQESGLKNLV
jgi:hypothetical protein